MTYDWENEIKSMLQLDIDDLEAFLPEGFTLVGICVENIETGEGALIEAYGAEHCEVVDADVRLDILGDADRQYNEVRDAAFKRKQPTHH